MSAAVIERAGPGDAPALAALAERTFRDTYTAFNSRENMDAYVRGAYGEARQHRELVDPAWITLVARAEGALVAYAQLRRGAAPACVGSDGAVELYRFYVDAPWHGRGLAQQLMAAAVRAAADTGAATLWLGVWERNARAIRFYTKTGFVDIGAQTFTLGDDVQHDRVLRRSTQPSP